MTIIGLKQFRENTADITRRVKQGESFIVVKRSEPQFQIVPISKDNQALDAWLNQYMTDNRELLEALADK
jgi:prevent-host-death family protein